MHARARACANLALVKYWGKRDASLNLPAEGSLSVTLAALTTTTSVDFLPDVASDTLEVDGLALEGQALARCGRVLDAVRRRAGLDRRARIVSTNDFPYGAGLASSASGMAALTVAAAAAAGWRAGPDELSAVARLGSGSAARSVHGGFVEWRRGEREDGEDSHGVLLHPADFWDLRVLVVIIDEQKKAVPSSEGMARTAASSPYYERWLAQSAADLEEARRLLGARDLAGLGALAESNTQRMHAAALAAAPGVIYWRGATIEVLHRLRALRAAGGPAGWFSIDAGPNVKVLTSAEDAEPLAAALSAVAGVRRVVASRVGGPALVLEESP